MRDELYQRVITVDARSAFDHLEAALGRAGLDIWYKLKGNVRSVDFKQRRQHFFSFIPNQGDLLFYVRRPALKPKPHLHQLALKHHPEQVNVDKWGRPAENSRKETKIRIRTKKDAETLMSWLGPEVRSLLQ
ncbi:hypothetical protein [Allosphingosinicella deserti]|uniref:DUF5655 domain-containing protein n=1 Tax=Allosphingosinicella deserti TaxID=2116704 RepID=A0A2P7QRK7_9SPHN|nr:hypothetical protein [Sphingomonas deserti]PSJ40595.1 hypothetical protein C7I55_09725 [Sphingomonas deserti]